ncbi:MAG: acyl carrier protein [Clostridia bacterium]|nr:acyl carrier protein [Clostridia bacterium]
MIERLKRILIQVAPNTDLDEIRPETRLIADLGLASMDFIMLMMEIEDVFGFEFTDEVNFQTVDEVCQYIQRHATKNC